MAGTDLIAGYKVIEYPRHATAAYRGVLRRTPGSRPSWSCSCPSPHLSPVTARGCAERELERRGQGSREVFTLLHCKRCAEGGGSSWWDDVPGEEGLKCPRCGVPLERLKLVVVGSAPAVDGGNRKH